MKTQSDEVTDDQQSLSLERVNKYGKDSAGYIKEVDASGVDYDHNIVWKFYKSGAKNLAFNLKATADPYKNTL